MNGYVARVLRWAYDIINPLYVDKDLARVQELKKSGELEEMCASEIHRLFGVCRDSSEI